jgi:hypothetical protein
MSASVKLLQGVATGSVSGKLLLLHINLLSPFATESEQVPRVCFETFSVFSGPVSSACFSLENHCCLPKKNMMVKRTAMQGAYVYMFQNHGRFDDSTHLKGIISV